MYLLDTNVVSELRRMRPHGAVLAWIASVPEGALHLSAVTIGELQTGIERTRNRDPGKAAELEAWVVRVASDYPILSIDGAAFRQWARLMHLRSNDLFQDAMIAATATVNNLIIVTGNVRDFEPFGVTMLNPFKV